MKKFVIAWSHFVTLLKSDFNVQQTGLRHVRRCVCLTSKLDLNDTTKCAQIHNCLCIWSHFVVMLKSDLSVQQSGLRFMQWQVCWISKSGLRSTIVVPDFTEIIFNDISEFGHRVVVKHELLFNKLASEAGLFNIQVGLSVTRILTLAFMNLVTPKTGSKHEPLFNKLRRVCWTKACA